MFTQKQAHEQRKNEKLMDNMGGTTSTSSSCMVSVWYGKDCLGMANESDEKVCSKDDAQGKDKYEQESEDDDSYDPNGLDS